MIRYQIRRYAAQPFDHLRGLDGISDEQIAEHLRLYGGYVNQVNALNEQLTELAGLGKLTGRDPEFAELTRRLGFEYNGMVLHEYYFRNLRRAAAPAPAPNSALAEALTKAFGSVEHWRAAFQGVGTMRGVGWAALFEDSGTGQLTNHWIELHQDGIVTGFKPLLVMDVWEHAFMRDYRATERVRYIETFFRNVDWQVVEGRMRGGASIRSAAA